MHKTNSFICYYMELRLRHRAFVSFPASLLSQVSLLPRYEQSPRSKYINASAGNGFGILLVALRRVHASTIGVKIAFFSLYRIVYLLISTFTCVISPFNPLFSPSHIIILMFATIYLSIVDASLFLCVCDHMRDREREYDRALEKKREMLGGWKQRHPKVMITATNKHKCQVNYRND